MIQRSVICELAIKYNIFVEDRVLICYFGNRLLCASLEKLVHSLQSEHSSIGEIV